MTLAQLRALALVYLGTASDDPAYPATTLNLVAQTAYAQLLADAADVNPGYLSTTVTLTADSATAITYTFSTQSTPITNFHKWLEVRWTDATGARLMEVRPEELDRSGPGSFALTGSDDTPVLTLGYNSTPGMALFFRYAFTPPALVVDTDVPSALPSAYHDVLALRMAAQAYALGNEATFPAALAVLLQDRQASMLAGIGRRGVQVNRTRGFSAGDAIGATSGLWV